MSSSDSDSLNLLCADIAAGGADVDTSMSSKADSGLSRLFQNLPGAAGAAFGAAAGAAALVGTRPA